MAKAKKAEQPETATDQESTLESAAKAVGAALGKIAVTTGIAHPPDAAPRPSGKLVAKDKPRLPRKEKKMVRKRKAQEALAAQSR